MAAKIPDPARCGQSHTPSPGAAARRPRAASIAGMKIPFGARARLGSLAAPVWRRLSGRTQWRLARLRHQTFLVYAGGIVQDERGRILLLRHRLWPPYRAWGLPGGYVDAGERLEDGVAREVREETALEVEVTAPPLHVASGFRHRVEAYYAARIVGGRLDLDAGEILEARWWPLDALPEEMSPRLRGVITSLDLSRG
ncbi:hypothetical protein GCM10023088_67090 [Actinomadura verrucosospora]